MSETCRKCSAPITGSADGLFGTCTSCIREKQQDQIRAQYADASEEVTLWGQTWNMPRRLAARYAESEVREDYYGAVTVSDIESTERAGAPSPSVTITPEDFAPRKGILTRHRPSDLCTYGAAEIPLPAWRAISLDPMDPVRSAILDALQPKSSREELHKQLVDEIRTGLASFIGKPADYEKIRGVTMKALDGQFPTPTCKVEDVSSAEDLENGQMTVNISVPWIWPIVQVEGEDWRIIEPDGRPIPRD